jgi:type IV secretion system protein VirB1
MSAIVRVESSGNPYAIGVVGGRLSRQPANKDEAIATAKALTQAGYNFSVGMSQVNRYNLPRYELDYDKAFEPCANVKAGAAILRDCYERAAAKVGPGDGALKAAVSCYYSGNFSTGMKPDFVGQPSYVQKVANHAVPVAGTGTGYVVPAIATGPVRKGAQPIPVVPMKGLSQQTPKAESRREAPEDTAEPPKTPDDDSAMVF